MELEIDFKRLFKGVNRKAKKKLTKGQKNRLEYLIKAQIVLFGLQKALKAGETVPGNLIRGSALMVEPLDVTMKMVTFDTKHLKLHKELNGPQRSNEESERNRPPPTSKRTPKRIKNGKRKIRRKKIRRQ